MRVTLLDPAAREVVEAVEYYEPQRAGMGAALDADLDRALHSFQTAPG